MTFFKQKNLTFGSSPYPLENPGGAIRKSDLLRVIKQAERIRIIINCGVA